MFYYLSKTVFVSFGLVLGPLYGFNFFDFELKNSPNTSEGHAKKKETSKHTRTNLFIL